MLRVDKTTLGPFGEPELLALLNAQGWRGVLPQALNDGQLLRVADQLRNILAGKKRNAPLEPGSAALPIALLLVAQLGGDAEALTTNLVALQEILTVLSVMVEREIVNRLLQRWDDEPDSGLLPILQELLGTHNALPQATRPVLLSQRPAPRTRPARSATRPAPRRRQPAGSMLRQ